MFEGTANQIMKLIERLENPRYPDELRQRTKQEIRKILDNAVQYTDQVNTTSWKLVDQLLH